MSFILKVILMKLIATCMLFISLTLFLNSYGERDSNILSLCWESCTKIMHI